jgi:hypothetical protein
MMTQSESVVFFARQVLGDQFKPGVPVLTYITKEQISQIVDLVTASILEGGTDFSAAARSKYDEPKKVRSYVVGMVNNWFRKGKELNGGGVYVPKNPGSRAGTGDPELRELKLLRKALTERNAKPEALAKVDAAIAARLEALGATKKVEINFDLIPDELKGLI